MRPPAQDVLARRYRKLLLSYPRDYRTERGEELLGLLLDDARPGQTRPHPRDALDVVSHGLRRRLREDATPGLATGLGIAAPIALALAAGLAGFMCLTVEITGEGAAGHPLGPFATVGPLAYFVWILAAIGNALIPRRAVRHDLIIAAMASTALLVPAAAFLDAARPPLWSIAALLLYGAIALTGSAADALVSVRRGAFLTALLIAALLTLAVHWWPPTRAGVPFYYSTGLRTAGILVLTVLAALVLVGAFASAFRTSARHWWWALIALTFPALWLFRLDFPLTLSALGLPPLGRLAQFILATSAVGAILGWRAARTAISPIRHGIVGTVALACVLGLGAALGLAGYFAAAPWAPQVTGVLAALGAIAFLDLAPSGRRMRPGVLLGALVAFLTALFVGVYGHRWRLDTWTDLLGDPPLIAHLALPALTLAAVTGYHGVRSGTGRAVLRHGAIATVSGAGIICVVAPHPAILALAPLGVIGYAAHRHQR